MSLQFLTRIVNARFPLVVRQATEVDTVRLLKAAELITASVPHAMLDIQPGDVSGDVSEAVIFGVTERGELAVREAKAPAEAPLRRGRRRLDDD